MLEILIADPVLKVPPPPLPPQMGLFLVPGEECQWLKGRTRYHGEWFLAVISLHGLKVIGGVARATEWPLTLDGPSYGLTVIRDG